MEENSLYYNIRAESSQKNNRNQNKQGAIRKQKNNQSTSKNNNNKSKKKSGSNNTEMKEVIQQVNDMDLASTSIDEPKVDEVKSKPADTAASLLWNKSLLEYAEDQFQCCICTEMIVNAVTLNCSHTFCKYCIMEWKSKKSICPICRVKILVQLPTKIVDGFIDKLIENSSTEIKTHRKQLIEEREKSEKLFDKSNCGCGNCEPFNDDDDDDYEDESSDSLLSYMLPYFENQFETDYDNDALEEIVFSYSPPSEATFEPETSAPGPSTVNGAYYGGYGRCFSCGETGHWRNGCPERRNYYGYGACFSCGEVGHWANNCPNR